MVKRAVFCLAIFLFGVLGYSTVASDDILKAVKDGDLGKVKAILEKNPESMNAKADNGTTLLHIAATHSHPDIMKILIDAGADVNTRDNYQSAPLHMSALKGDLECLKVLMDNKADKNPKNKFGFTPLHYAAFRGNKEFLRAVVNAGANLSIGAKDGYTLLHDMIDYKDVDIISFIIDIGANVKARSDYGLTPLHIAASHGKKDVVELLIKKGADVNAVDDGGDTPIHGAAWGGHEDVVSLLIQNGAKIDVRNNNGNTPLDNSRINGQEDVTSLVELKSSAKKSVSDTALAPKLERNDIGEGTEKEIKITILYDNYVFKEGTKSEWGFSCLIEGTEDTILFDTGGVSEVLMHNIDAMKVDLSKIDKIVISHIHWDHVGGLFAVLEKNSDVTVYLPISFPYEFVRKVEKTGAVVKSIKESTKICKNVFSTGEMGTDIKEQSIFINTKKGLVVITGCSHQGIVNILKRAREVIDKSIYIVFGGFHLMRHSEEQVMDIIGQFKKLGVVNCGATHCTGDKAIGMFRKAFGDRYVDMGTGRILIINKK